LVERIFVQSKKSPKQKGKKENAKVVKKGSGKISGLVERTKNKSFIIKVPT